MAAKNLAFGEAAFGVELPAPVHRGLGPEGKGGRVNRLRTLSRRLPSPVLPRSV